MILQNNPRINVNELKEEILILASKIPSHIDSSRLLSSSTDALRARMKSVENNISQCETLLAPRTDLPNRLKRFPFNRLPIIKRLVLSIDNILFARQREMQKNMTNILYQLVEAHKQQAVDLQMLAQQVESLKGNDINNDKK